MNLRYVLLYHFMIIVPFVLLLQLGKLDYINPAAFLAGIFIYAFIYHPLISGIRLVSLQLITTQELPKTFIPGWNLRFAKELYLQWK